MKAKKVLFSALSMIFTLSIFAGCGGGATNSTSNQGGASNSNKVEEEIYEPEELESNGESLANYQIVVAADATESYYYAAEIFQKYFKASTKVEIPVVTDATPEGTHEIIIGNTNRSECQSYDYEELGVESFIVETVDTDLVIAGGKRGVIYGVYDYLEALGFRFYAPKVEFVPKARNVFIAEDVELEWTPIFTHRDPFYESSNHLYPDIDAAIEFAVAQRINSSYIREPLRSEPKYGGGSGYIGGDGMKVHTVGKYVPYSSYGKAHPDWFSATGANPCFTSPGFLEELYMKVLQQIRRDNKGNIIDISMNDSGEYCLCDRCKESYEQYGVSETYYRAINDIAIKLQTDAPGIRVNTISYAFATEPPRTLVLADNFDMTVCITSCRYHTDPAACKATCFGDGRGGKNYSPLGDQWDRILGWDGHAPSITAYWYAVNWGNLYSIDPSYEGIYNNFKWFAEHNVTGVYAESYSRPNPEFGELKAYLSAKMMADPLMSKAEFDYYMDDFLLGYYGEGGEYIGEYIDRTYELMLEKMERSGHLANWYDFADNLDFDYNPKTKEFAPFVKEFNELWDEAESLATPAQLTRIEKSRIHWDYIELYNTWDRCYQNADLEGKNAMEARSKNLYKRIKDFNILQRYDNDADIRNVSDFSISPATWW